MWNTTAFGGAESKYRIEYYIYWVVALSLAALSPLIILVNLYSEVLTDVFTGLFLLSWYTPVIIISVFAGISLWVKKPYGLNLAKIVLVYFIIDNLITIASGDLSYIRYFIVDILFLVFLHTSKYVREIYSRKKENISGYQFWSILCFVFSFFSPVLALLLGIKAIKNIMKNQKIKGMILSIAGIVISLLYISLLVILIGIFSSTSYGSPLLASAGNSNIINACDAANYIGEYKTVQGYVVDVFHSTSSNTVFLNFDKPYPDHCFTAVIFSNDLSKFGNFNIYEGKTVQVTGEIQYYQGKPEIVLENPSQINII